jgi:hypothetical protein
MGKTERAWPLCHRPFADETFGSWFGRVGARCRLNVDQLAVAADIPLDLRPNCQRWLTIAPPTEIDVLSRICILAARPRVPCRR